MKGMRGLVVKALPIDGIDAIKFDAAGIDEIGERADQSLAFEFPFIAGAGGKTNNGRAPMAVNDDAEFPSDAVRIPAVIVALHESAFRIPNSRSEYAKVCQRKWAQGNVRAGVARYVSGEFAYKGGTALGKENSQVWNSRRIRTAR